MIPVCLRGHAIWTVVPVVKSLMDPKSYYTILSGQKHGTYWHMADLWHMYITILMANLCGLPVAAVRNCGLSFIQNHQRDKKKSLENLFHFYDKLLLDLSEIPDGFEICLILLEPGNVLWVWPFVCISIPHLEFSIMPPGMWHTVYTPVSCMTSGVHFLIYNTMHLTYTACAIDSLKYPDDKDQLQGDYAMNKSQSVDRQIIWMVLALKYVAHAPSKCLTTIK